jgi:hypothetical protein
VLSPSGQLLVGFSTCVVVSAVWAATRSDMWMYQQARSSLIRVRETAAMIFDHIILLLLILLGLGVVFLLALVVRACVID